MVSEKSQSMKTFIQDGDLGISYQDEGPWRSYEVVDCCGETPQDAVENLTVSEIDQDGGELDCYGFDDAPYEVQNKILKLMCVSWEQLDEK